MRDFCEGETFQARCPPGEVVLIQNATLGRMKLGRCVQIDMGYLGCAGDVLDVADIKCSGRRECDISIPDPVIKLKKPCMELITYLEISYGCLQGKAGHKFFVAMHKHPLVEIHCW